MEHLINRHVKDIQISGIRQFNNYVSQFPDVLSLTLGQPDFHTPDIVKQSGIKAIEENITNYTPNAGLLPLRKAVVDFMEERYHLVYNPEDEVIVTIGASQGIDIALRTILEVGSEVIIPAPVYPAYEPIIRLCGGIPVLVDTTDSHFVLTAEKLEKAITEQTRCVILPYPSNPIGVTISHEQLSHIVAILEDKEIFVLSDEIYSELTYSEEYYSVAQFPSMRNKTIVINGLSKSHSMTGWRIGFTFAPAYITKQMLKVHQYNVSCASSISQMAALSALTKAKDSPQQMAEDYKVRRDFMYKRLTDIGLEVVYPTGAFYMFPSIKKYGLTSYEFATTLVEKQRLAVIPGSAFSEYGEGYIRLSYAYSMESLNIALDRLENFITDLESEAK